jgi:aldehyde dehydrogenase (NAD+)
MDNELLGQLAAIKAFFKKGSTLPYSFRRQKLMDLKKAILQNEPDIFQALHTDLKKNREESWVTETGFLLAEINHTIKNLRRWMKRKKVPTNLVNFPSKSYIYKEPLGVVLIIGTWNYPLQLLLTPLAGAIAAGNCVVLKPSEFAPATAAVIEKIITAIFPPEYVLLVKGEGSVIVPELINQFRFDHIFYTGGTNVGKIIYQMAAKQLIPVTLEMGGKSPCVVDETASIKIAAKRIALTKFSNAGQMCVAPDYVLVHQSKKQELIDELIKNIQKFFSKDASSSEDYGKIINEKQFQRLIGYLSNSKIAYGGKYNKETSYIEPAILEDVSIQDAVMGDEIFGPILPILSYSSFEEALSIIHHNPDPLAFYIFTENKEAENKWLQSVSFGGGCVNNASWHITNYNLPFGGKGNSGLGNYHGNYSFDLFSHQKAVMKTPTWFDPAIKYPPFKGKLNLFRKIVQ